MQKQSCMQQHLGAAEAKSVESMMSDLGFVVKPVWIIDAKATEHILHRQGIGKMKHIDVAHLRLQDDVTSKRISRTSGAQQQNHQKACKIHKVC